MYKISLYDLHNAIYIWQTSKFLPCNFVQPNVVLPKRVPPLAPHFYCSA